MDREKISSDKKDELVLRYVNRPNESMNIGGVNIADYLRDPVILERAARKGGYSIEKLNYLIRKKKQDNRARVHKIHSGLIYH